MPKLRDLVVVLAEGAMSLTLLWCALGASSGYLVFGNGKIPNDPTVLQAAVLAAVIGLPLAFGCSWVFRRLRGQRPTREALWIALSFGLFGLISLPIAILVADITGAYASYLGRPFGLLGALAGVVVIVTTTTFVPSAFVGWIMTKSNRQD